MTIIERPERGEAQADQQDVPKPLFTGTLTIVTFIFVYLKEVKHRPATGCAETSSVNSVPELLVEAGRGHCYLSFQDLLSKHELT